MRVKTSDFWQAWKGVILLTLFQLVFQPLFWAADKIGYKSGNWDLMSWVEILFAFLVWGVPIVYGIMSKEGERLSGAFWFFVVNNIFFFGIAFVVFYNVYTARNMFPQWLFW